MSSNKIGFFGAFWLYAMLVCAYFALDFQNLLIGEAKKGATIFTITLENIASKGDSSVVMPQKPHEMPLNPQNPSKPKIEPKRESLKPNPPNPPREMPKIAQNAPEIIEIPRESAIESSADSSEDSSESLSADSSANSHKNSEFSAHASDGTSGEYDAYFLEIKKIIDKYHAKSRAPNGARGAVEIAFLVNKDGSISDLCVLKSSGSARLDRLSLETVRRAAKAFPEPKSERHIKITLAYVSK